MYLTIFGKPRYLGLIKAEDENTFVRGERVLIESSRGVEIGVVAGEITEKQEGLYRSIENRQEGESSSDLGLQNVTFLERVGPAELKQEQENRHDEDIALVTSRQVLAKHPLDMKLVDVEYMFDRKKLFLYFTSEQRVDFRAYVRDLAREFRTRIELRQIGVRDESKVVKGIGACGRVCCCSYWLHRFMPIGIKMVKEQNLALNPTKISGLCGRLMCCMCFEQKTYRELWKKLPAPGTKIKTEQGTWVLSGVDIAAKSCVLHGPNGVVSVPVEQYQSFKESLLAGDASEKESYAATGERPLSPTVQTRPSGNAKDADFTKNTRSADSGAASTASERQSAPGANKPNAKSAELHRQRGVKQLPARRGVAAAGKGERKGTRDTKMGREEEGVRTNDQPPRKRDLQSMADEKKPRQSGPSQKNFTPRAVKAAALPSVSEPESKNVEGEL